MANKRNSPNNWYVITGAPSSGKTTIINLIEEKGFRVVREAARTYIDEQIAEGKTIQEIRKNEMAFQKKILELKIALEKKLSPEEIIFFDRGIPDSVAYYTLYSAGEDVFLNDAIDKCSYKKVFILDMLPYEKDHARTEGDEQRKMLHDFLFEAYRRLAFRVAIVPAMPPEQRLAYILNNI